MEGPLSFCILLLVSLVPAWAHPADSPAVSVAAAAPTAAGVTLNIHDFGAVGDGRVHLVAEWIKAGRFSSFRALQQKYAFVDGPGWSLDEVAFAAAKQALRAEGGTIYFPVGHYVTARYPWGILRDNVRIRGDGAEKTILSGGPEVAEGLVLAPYRHLGWLEGARREYPFAASSGSRGAASVQLTVANWSREFQPGDLVFIRDGANRYDQDYGEFNEVAAPGPDGQLCFKHPLARDYTLAEFNWAGEIAADFTMPAPGGAVRVTLRSGEGYFSPRVNTVISVGENLFCVEKVGPEPNSLRLANDGRANAPSGTVISAGTRVGKSRSILKLTRTTRNFQCENLQIIGRRKAVNLSNSFGSVFTDCTFVRDTRDGVTKGGLTIDGDGGRFACFERCKVIALPAAGMQFARSFGSVTFADCTFVDTNVAFTEFNFDCEVRNCSFEVKGGAGLANVVIAGRSCGDLRFIDNHIRASNLATVFDELQDIHSQKHGGDGSVILRGNTVEAMDVGSIFSPAKSAHFATENNRIAIR